MKPPRASRSPAVVSCTRCEIAAWSAAVLTMLGGILTSILMPQYAEHVLDTQFLLRPASDLYNMWKLTPIPLSLNFYLFNWTNPEQLREPGAKPRLQQVGPYRYTERFEKTDVKFNPSNDTVTYRNMKTWWWDAAGSNGTLNDRITALNAVAVSAAYAARNFNYVMRRGLSLTLSATVDALHVTRSVDELLFTGYRDGLIDLTRNLPAFEGMENPGWERFAWFYGRNGSRHASGTMNMATGYGAYPMGELLEWDYQQNKTRFWGDTECAHVRGSAGEFFPPHLKRGQTINMYLPEMCRSVSLQWDSEVITEYGLLGYRYVADAQMLDNGTEYPENSCFCPGECQPSGVMNVSACRYGSPGFISLPHFHKADPYYLGLVDGLKPDDNLHSFYLVLEPRTGIPLDVTARFQINIMTRHVDDIAFATDLPTIYFPIMWLEQSAKAPKAYALALLVLLRMSEWGWWGGVTVTIVGAVCLAALTLVYLYRRLRQRAPPPPAREEVPLTLKTIT